MKNFKLYLSILCLGLFSSNAVAQCTWTQYAFESFEYTTTIPGLIPGSTYQNTPQTYAAHAGTYGLYMNFVDGFSGVAYDQQYTVCAGKNYRFSFWTRDAFTSTNNLTFRVLDASNNVLSTQNVINGSTWQNITIPAFTPPTATIRFQIITNTPGTGGNDAAVDEIKLEICAPSPVASSKSVCASSPAFNLFSDLTTTTQTGTWTGPSALTNGYLGTFTPGTNTSGTYTYTISNGAGCPDSVWNVQVASVITPSITPPSNTSGCGSYTLPAITGTNITPNARYYTGPGATGTVYNAGAVITTPQTLYIYDGASGCSDEEMITITISSSNQAGTDGSIASCGSMGIFDLTTLLNAPYTSGGTWAETTSPPSGQLSGSNFNTSNVPTGQDYTFTYTVPANGACPTDVANFSVQIGNVDDVSLGNDTTICPGTTLVLSPGVYDSYLWNNGSTNPTRTVTLPGTYWVTVGNVSDNADNVIINGDFESGVNNFTTQYVPGTGGTYGALSNPGTYAITSSPNMVHSNFASFPDHTPAPGTQMLVVNGAGTANTNVWCQNNIPVSPNTFYQFGTWVTSVENNSLPLAQLQFSIGGAVQGSVFAPTATANNWLQFTTSWFSGAQTSTSICIVNQNTSTGGNDFAIDDITFIPLCSATDSIVVANWPQPTISVTPNDTICAGQTGTLTASSATSPITYNWTPGNLNTATINVTPAVTTIYSVSGTSEHGCISNIVNRSIVVRPTPVAGIFLNGGNPVCPGTETILNGSSSFGGVTYQWSTGETTPTIVVTATAPSSSYTLTVTSPAGCSSDSTVTIGVYPQLDVTISGNSSFCDGDNTTLTASGNVPGMTFVWSEGQQTTSSITVDHGGWIYVTGDFADCPQAEDSVLLTENPNPVVTVPEDFEVCPGEAVQATVSSSIPGSTFLWQPGNLTGATNSITTNSATVYTVIAQNGSCVSEPQQFSIVASAACYLAVPNVFTPNGDNNNDFFQLVNSEGLQSISCVIVNRWGETVASFDTPAFKWDGKDKTGGEASDGVYFYRIEAVTKANQELNETGFVQLVRH